MKYFIAYSTIEGQTRKIAETVASVIERAGDHAVIMNISDLLEFTLERPDGAILCAPIHIGRYPSSFADFVHREAEWLNAVPSAFVSVTLAIRSDNESERREAMHFADVLTEQTDWRPRLVHHAAGALRFTQYDFFKRWMMRRISEKEGGPTDTSQDYELTDWKALQMFVADFLERTGSANAAKCRAMA
jgi:menaquinone-dependent protoporphyrinogen oxidase